MGKKIVVLHSGGLDSTVMWKMAKELDESNEVIAVYFDIGHDYAWKEKEKLPIGAIIHDMTWFQAQGHCPPCYEQHFYSWSEHDVCNNCSL